MFAAEIRAGVLVILPSPLAPNAGTLHLLGRRKRVCCGKHSPATASLSAATPPQTPAFASDPDHVDVLCAVTHLLSR